MIRKKVNRFFSYCESTFHIKERKWFVSIFFQIFQERLLACTHTVLFHGTVEQRLRGQRVDMICVIWGLQTTYWVVCLLSVWRPGFGLKVTVLRDVKDSDELTDSSSESYGETCGINYLLNDGILKFNENIKLIMHKTCFNVSLKVFTHSRIKDCFYKT